MLPSTVPDTLEMLKEPRAGASDTAQELARHIRE